MAIANKKLTGGKLTPYQQALQTATAAAAGTNLRDMIRGGATEAELQAYNDSKIIPQSYLDRQGRQNYTFWNAGRSTIGDYGIDNSNAETWKQIEAAYNAGDTTRAAELVNGLSDQGKFGGYYDDNGLYYGFAQGYQGGANASYQPVVGGKLINTGLDTTGTSIWLTPDGKALSMGAGGALTDNGDTWSRYKQSDIADVQAKQRETLEAGKKKAETYIPDLVASGADVPASMYPANLGYEPPTNVYQRALSQYTGGSGTQPTVQPTGNVYSDYLAQYAGQPSAAPQATQQGRYTDPYQAKRDALLDAYGEQWGGSKYQPLRDEYLQKAADMTWDYNPETDPVYQAYRKQYLREGQRATEDTLGRMAAMTGGMPSTAAATAASQAGDYYASQLTDKIPQLYQDAYNRYLQEYQKALGISGEYADADQTEYQRWLQGQGQKLDQADRLYQYGNQDYDRYRDTIADQRYADETAYSRYRDQISDQRYDQEWAQKLREYADAQNWKATEWQQYLREYGDKLSQQEREWVYQQARDAESDRRWNLQWEYGKDQDTLDRERQARLDAISEAEMRYQYGDTGGLADLGVDTSKAEAKEVAYASDGSTYKFNTPDALYFVQNAPNGQPDQPTTMRGSDGSIWRKDEYGNVTIEHKGKVFQYGQQQTGGDTDTLSMLAAMGITSEGQAYSWLRANGYGDAEAGKFAKYYAQMLGGSGNSGSGYTGGSGGGSGGNTKDTPASDNDALSQMMALGIKSRAQAYSWLLANGYDKSSASFDAAEKLADYYAQMIGEDDGAPKYDDATLEKAWKYADSKDSSLKAWAQGVLSEQYGMEFGAQDMESEDQGAGYNNFVEILDSMVRRGASRDEIFAEINAEVKDGNITKEQGETLKNQYYGSADNVENSGRTWRDGKPESAGFNRTMQQAETMASMGSDNDSIEALKSFLREAVETGKIHEYEIDYILDRLGL